MRVLHTHSMSMSSDVSTIRAAEFQNIDSLLYSHHMSQIVTRMAPSPTGKFHVGGVRTALYNYLFARQNDGKFILRSEDTDKERSKPEYEENMKETLAWLGLDYDEFYRQSDRLSIYQEQLQKLIDSGKAYEAEASKDDPTKPVIRFKNPNVKVRFRDIILGDIEFDTTELGDFVIARNKENPIYHFTVVVDDGLMGVTHVIRGQEHINNTPRQILILEALGFARPQYAHIPLIMSPRGGKLSKRDPEVIPALEYRDLGILPESLINFLAFIGWNPGDEREVMTKEELVKEFRLERVQKSGGVFNIEKLYWINKKYLQRLSEEKFISYIEPVMVEYRKKQKEFNEEMFRKILPLIRERVEAYRDLQEMIENGDFDYFFERPAIDREKLVWKKADVEETERHLHYLQELLAGYDGAFTADKLKELIWPYAEEQGRGNVLWPLRYALSGKEKSPDPFTLLEILGKEESLARVEEALKR